MPSLGPVLAFREPPWRLEEPLGPPKMFLHGLHNSVIFLALVLISEDARSRAAWWRKMVELGACEKGRPVEWTLEVGDAVPEPPSPRLKGKYRSSAPTWPQSRIFPETPSDHAGAPGARSAPGAPPNAAPRAIPLNIKGVILALLTSVPSIDKLSLVTLRNRLQSTRRDY